MRIINLPRFFTGFTFFTTLLVSGLLILSCGPQKDYSAHKKVLQERLKIQTELTARLENPGDVNKVIAAYKKFGADVKALQKKREQVFLTAPVNPKSPPAELADLYKQIEEANKKLDLAAKYAQLKFKQNPEFMKTLKELIKQRDALPAARSTSRAQDPN